MTLKLNAKNEWKFTFLNNKFKVFVQLSMNMSTHETD